MTPLLHIIFGIPYNIAVGSSLAVIGFTAMAAAIKQFRYHHVKIRLAVSILIGSITGAKVGSALLNSIKNAGYLTINNRQILVMDFVVNIAYIILLLIMSGVMFREGKKAIKAAAENPQRCLF